MAGMRPRGGSVSSRRRSGGGGGVVRPVYEDLKPMSEWQQDDDSHILNINLPGFMKEQIKVSTRGHNTIIVRGERLVAGNKWSHFHEEFQVPGETMNSLQVDYQGGTLYITIPKEEVEKCENYSKPTGLDNSHEQLPNPFMDQTKVSPKINPQETTNEKCLHSTEKYAPLEEREDDVTKETMGKEDNYEGSHNWVNIEPGNNETMFEEDETSDILEHIVNNKELYVGKTETKKYKTMATQENGHEHNERKLKMNIKVAMLVIVAIIAYAKYKFASLGEDY